MCWDRYAKNIDVLSLYDSDQLQDLYCLVNVVLYEIGLVGNPYLDDVRHLRKLNSADKHGLIDRRRRLLLSRRNKTI